MSNTEDNILHLTNVGIFNFLFYTGTSGCFIANMVSEAIVHPYDVKYDPAYVNDDFEKANEFTAPHRHIANVFHPFSQEYERLPDLSKLYGTKWCIINITPENYRFASIINAYKRQHKEDWNRTETFEEIKRQIDGNDSSDKWYQEHLASVKKIKQQLLDQNNTVIEVEFDELFSLGSDSGVVQVKAIFDMIYMDYTNPLIIRNIAEKCWIKHQRDIKLYNEIHTELVFSEFFTD